MNTDPRKKEGEIDFSSSLSLGNTTEINTDELWKKVDASILRILHHRFSDSTKRIPKTHRDRIAFACPYCGDSTYDNGKKRGNLFSTSMNYHCFNGECGAHHSIVNFLKDFNELNSFTFDEVNFFRERSKELSRNFTATHQEAIQNIETLFSDEAMSLTVPRGDIMRRFNLKEIKGSRIEGYLTKRYQTKFTRFGFDPKRGNIYIFNLAADGIRVLGYQIKTFSKRSAYLSYRTSGMHKALGIYKEENEEMLAKMDSIAYVFGMMQLNLSKTVTVFEGPFDSFLFPNSVGVCSGKNQFPFEIESIRYFYDNDASGKEWSIEKIGQGQSVFMWEKYLKENSLMEHSKKIKDLNDLLIFVKREKIKVKPFVNYFSIDKYDLIHV